MFYCVIITLPSLSYLLTASCFLCFEERQCADMMSPKCAAGAFIVSTEQILTAAISDKYDPVGAAGGVSVEQATDVTGEVSLPLWDVKNNTNRVG